MYYIQSQKSTWNGHFSRQTPCATVGLYVESANVVGYQSKAVRQFLSQQVCTFDQIGVSEGALDIQKLIPVDGEGDYIGNGAVTIQFISPLGAAQSFYSYYGKDEYDDDTPAGWYDEDEDELAVYTFAAGEAFNVYSSDPSVFQYSGEVNMAETDVPFRQYLSAQGNIRPAAVDIQDVIPVDDEGDYIGSGDITIQFISNLGAAQTFYSYYGKDEYDDDTPAGWYDEDEDELADYTFAAGEGFKLYAGTAGFLRFPEM